MAKIKQLDYQETIFKKHWWFPRGTIVFIHGYNSNWNVSNCFLTQLYNKRFNVYAFDLPNHGKSEVIEEPVFKKYCSFVIDKINSLNKKKIILIGHSMGGGIVSAINTNINNLKKIVLIDPLQKKARSNIVEFIKHPSKFFSLIRSAAHLLLHNNSQNKNLEKGKLLNEIVKEESIEDIENGLKSIQVPTLLIFGEDDDVIPPKESIEYIKSMVKPELLKVKTIKNSKHSPNCTNANELVEDIFNFYKNK